MIQACHQRLDMESVLKNKHRGILQKPWKLFFHLLEVNGQEFSLSNVLNWHNLVKGKTFIIQKGNVAAAGSKVFYCPSNSCAAFSWLLSPGMCRLKNLHGTALASRLHRNIGKKHMKQMPWWHHHFNRHRAL